VLVVDPPEPGLAVVEIGLVALGAAIRQPLAAKLNPRVGRRVALDPVFEREVEVGDRAIPPEKLVVAEFFTGGYLPGDSAVLDPPAVGRSAPARERPSKIGRGSAAMPARDAARIATTAITRRSQDPESMRRQPGMSRSLNT
jgi:hypothetical protein